MFDFGSIMGSGTTGPDTARSGRSYLIDAPTAWRVLRTFGIWAPSWARRHIAPYHPSVGPFTAEGFEPEEWKAEYPNAAFLNMRADDAFWGARRVAAFTDAQLQLLAEQGRYSDPAATAQVAQALIGRRDLIARTWLTQGDAARLADARGRPPALCQCGRRRPGRLATDELCRTVGALRQRHRHAHARRQRR